MREINRKGMCSILCPHTLGRVWAAPAVSIIFILRLVVQVVGSGRRDDYAWFGFICPDNASHIGQFQARYL